VASSILMPERKASASESHLHRARPPSRFRRCRRENSMAVSHVGGGAVYHRRGAGQWGTENSTGWPKHPASFYRSSANCQPRIEKSVAGARNQEPHGSKAVRALSPPNVAALARTCKPFRNTRPRSASDGHQAGQPTPIFRGRLRSAAVGAGLSRRRPRVRVPSTPPTILQ
jgi:hypothetical protein